MRPDAPETVIFMMAGSFGGAGRGWRMTVVLLTHYNYSEAQSQAVAPAVVKAAEPGKGQRGGVGERRWEPHVLGLVDGTSGCGSRCRLRGRSAIPRVARSAAEALSMVALTIKSLNELGIRGLNGAIQEKLA